MYIFSPSQKKAFEWKNNFVLLECCGPNTFLFEWGFCTVDWGDGGGVFCFRKYKPLGDLFAPFKTFEPQRLEVRSCPKQHSTLFKLHIKLSDEDKGSRGVFRVSKGGGDLQRTPPPRPPFSNKQINRQVPGTDIQIGRCQDRKK